MFSGNVALIASLHLFNTLFENELASTHSSKVHFTHVDFVLIFFALFNSVGKSLLIFPITNDVFDNLVSSYALLSTKHLILKRSFRERDLNLILSVFITLIPYNSSF